MAAAASLPFYHISERVLERHDIGSKFSVDAYPCFVALHEKKEVGRVLGADIGRLKSLVADLEKL